MREKLFKSLWAIYSLTQDGMVMTEANWSKCKRGIEGVGVKGESLCQYTLFVSFGCWLPP